MEIKAQQAYEKRKDIQEVLGGNLQMGIVKSTKAKAILLFVNEDELYSDRFYSKDGIAYLLYTGIGRIGHQDSIKNKNYYLNTAVLTHKEQENALLVFSKRNQNISLEELLN